MLTLVLHCFEKIMICFLQRDARKHNGAAPTDSSDPYNMEDIVMPLRDYITHPIARDIIHNGATFQVSKLYSFWLWSIMELLVH